MSIPGFLSNNIRVAEDLGSSMPLVCRDRLASRSIGITHDLQYKNKLKRIKQTIHKKDLTNIYG